MVLFSIFTNYSEVSDFYCLITEKKLISIFIVLLFFVVLVNVFPKIKI